MQNVQSFFNAHLLEKAREKNAKLSRGSCWVFFFSCKINTRTKSLPADMQHAALGRGNNSE